MAEEIFKHKHVLENGDIIDMRIFKIPTTDQNPDGVSYSLVYIREGKRLLGYDNFEGHVFHGKSHHRHIGKRVMAYDFVDQWKLIEDFNDDVEKIKRGVIQ